MFLLRVHFLERIMLTLVGNNSQVSHETASRGAGVSPSSRNYPPVHPHSQSDKPCLTPSSDIKMSNLLLTRTGILKLGSTSPLLLSLAIPPLTSLYSRLWSRPRVVSPPAHSRRSDSLVPIARAPSLCDAVHLSGRSLGCGLHHGGAIDLRALTPWGNRVTAMGVDQCAFGSAE
jgi:hypothetical protein